MQIIDHSVERLCGTSSNSLAAVWLSSKLLAIGLSWFLPLHQVTECPVPR